MSSADVRTKISLVETALKDAGTPNALNAIVDALKEIAKTLEILEGRPNQAQPRPEGRKFRDE
jgi:hypothetical protein